jgi:hypothetical protein
MSLAITEMPLSLISSVVIVDGMCPLRSPNGVPDKGRLPHLAFISVNAA